MGSTTMALMREKARMARIITIRPTIRENCMEMAEDSEMDA